MKKKDNDKIKKSVQTSSACGVTSVSRFFFAFLSFAESFVVEQQTLFWVDLIHISI